MSLWFGHMKCRINTYVHFVSKTVIVQIGLVPNFIKMQCVIITLLLDQNVGDAIPWADGHE